MNLQRYLALACAFLFATACCAAEQDAASGSCDGTGVAPAVEAPPNYSVPTYVDGTATDADDESSRNISEWQKNITATHDALVASRSPRDWALSTMFDQFPFADFPAPAEDASETNRELLRKAATAAPDDAVIKWISLWYERSVKDPQSDVRTALRSLEPSNVSLWMDDLDAAAKAKDETGVDFVLAQMSRGRVFDNRFALVNGALVEALQRFPLPPVATADGPKTESADVVAETMAMAVSAVYGFPAFQAVVNACRFDASTGTGASRRNDCAAVGRLMAQHGTDLISVQFGNVVLRVAKMYTDDDVRRSRETDWITTQFASFMSSATENDSAGIEHSKRWRETGNELDAMRATVAAAGLPTSPPPDWQDKSTKFSAEALQGDKKRFDELRAKSQ